MTEVQNSLMKDILQGNRHVGDKIVPTNKVQLPEAPESKPKPELEEKPKVEIDIEVIDLQEVVAKINDHIQTIERDLHFSVSKETGHTIITVTDSSTNRVVRQIPPDSLLKLAQLLQDSHAGLFQQKV